MDLPVSRSPSSPPLFGREEIIEATDQLLAHARGGHGQGLLLVGANGAGKTSVLGAVLEREGARDFRILKGHALPEELPSPFALVRNLLGSMSEEEPWSSLGAERTIPVPLGLEPYGNGAPASAPAVPPRASAALDDLDRILAPLGPSGGARLGASREELVGRVEEYFLTLARNRPLLVAIDDLHLADSSSLEVLGRFAVDLATIPAMVVATTGPSAEVPERVRGPLEALTQTSTFHTMPLRSLTIPEVAEFVRWICGGREPDPREVVRWHAQTDGNPLFVEQLVRMVTGYGPATATGPSDPGRDLNELLLVRARALGANDLRVLTYAAVLKKEFRFGDLAAVAGLDEERVTESLDRLVQQGLLREKGEEVYEFVTESLRASVYADLTETRRRILHAKAGLALEAKGEADESELARQFYLGRDIERAVKYNLAAAQSATQAFAFETAAAHLARALESERLRPERDLGAEMRILTQEGWLFTEMGSPHRSETVLTEAVGLARSHPGHELELARALLGLAQSRYQRGEYASAESLAQEAWTYLPKVGSRRDLMAAHRVLGLLYWRRGDLQRAEAEQRAVLEIAQDEGTSLEQGHALIDVANLLVFSTQVGGRYEAALDLYARAADLFAEGENYGARARALMNRAVLYWEAGHTDEAAREFPLAIEAAERARSPRWIGWCYFNLAQMQAELGQIESSRKSLERAERVLAPVGDRFGELQIVLTRGMIAHGVGAFDTAEQEYLTALEQARELHLPSEVSEILFRRAQLSHDRGSDVEARERLAEARTAGVLDHRPDFTPRVTALERALASSSNA